MTVLFKSWFKGKSTSMMFQWSWNFVDNLNLPFTTYIPSAQHQYDPSVMLSKEKNANLMQKSLDASTIFDGPGCDRCQGNQRRWKKAGTVETSPIPARFEISILLKFNWNDEFEALNTRINGQMVIYNDIWAICVIFPAGISRFSDAKKTKKNDQNNPTKSLFFPLSSHKITSGLTYRRKKLRRIIIYDFWMD